MSIEISKRSLKGGLLKMLPEKRVKLTEFLTDNL